ncbi:MAG: 23S rRNA (uracil(1939)-C(5))-methyltransferase RlmD [Ignavibacteriales bacterium]|nr:23S rRNA (uracil(1939)-C(5))-methyltransferase RlmD [Ignavibacteriales bacterium]
MKKGELLELEISKYAFEGKGIARIDLENNKPFSVEDTQEKKNFVIFVNGSYPGDKVIAKIIKVKSSYAEAKIENILSPSPERIIAECKHFGICGGCKQQDLNYLTQLKYKQEQVKDIFDRLGGFENYEMLTVVPSKKQFFYRNKLEFSFADKKWLTNLDMERIIPDNNFALGFHVPRIFNKVLDIESCHLQSEESNQILNFTREFFKTRNSTIYSTYTHSGYLRNLVVKQSRTTNDLMVNLVTSEENDDLIEEYTKSIIKRIPEITTVVNNISTKKAAIALGDYEKIFFGNGFIYDSIGKYKFRISPNSFFQTNTLQAENLYQTTLDFTELAGSEIVYDLYSGSGTISIFISDNCKKVFAFEMIDSSIADAQENSKLNNTKNVQFISADLNKSFLGIAKEKELPKPDTIIIDPPRTGMNPATVNDVIELNPKRIVYVSCNPTTQVRDLKLFESAGYKLLKIKPVDMFPHTYHIENVALMEK